MEAQALPQRRPLPWRRVLLSAAALVAVALIAGALAGFVWLRGYEPLDRGNTAGSNPGDGVMVQPPVGSGGTGVFFPRYRENGSFRVQAGVRNHGRFTVSVIGVPRPDPEDPLSLVAAEVSPPTRPSYHGSPIDANHPIRLRPGDQRDITFVYRFNGRCIGGQPPRYWANPTATYLSSRTAPLRIKYARWFDKTQNFTLPFAITLVCKSGWTNPHR